MTVDASPSLATIERHAIDYVPTRERHGSVRGQGVFWFLANFHFLTIATGFIGPGMGLSLGWTLLASIAGLLFGTAFMAVHASQGPSLGVPQMVQSRAQFGVRGVIVPLFGALFNFLAFNVVETMLIDQGFNGMFGWNATAVGVGLAVVSFALAVWGHDWLHLSFRVLFWISLPLLLILSVALFGGFVTLPVAPLAAGAAPVVLGWSAVAFAAQFSACAAFNLSYGPCVSDYTRYLSRRRANGALIAAVYIGASLSAIWLMALGSWLAVRFGASDGLLALRDAGEALFPHFGTVLAVLSVLILLATMGLNAYSAALTVLTGIDSIHPLPASRAPRIVTTAAMAVLWLVIALALNASAIDSLYAALSVMLYLLVPWSSINLVDYFLIRRRMIAVTDLFRADGVYGSWSARGLLAYCLGLLVSVPFWVVGTFWVGPVADRLGGIDIGWLVGLIVSGVLYGLLSINHRPAREIEAARLSDAVLARMDEAA